MPASTVSVRQPAAASPIARAAYLAGLIAVAHGVNDAYTAFLSPLLPRIMEKMGLSIALAAVLAMTLSMAASVLQPVMGYLSDRYDRRLFVALGPLLSAIFLSLIGVPSSFWILIAVLLLGGLGSALFHPPGASLSARISEGKGSGLRLSVFSLGGSLGWAVGPLLAVGLVDWLGLESLWIAMFPGILMFLLLVRFVPSGTRESAERGTGLRRGTSLERSPPSVNEILALLRGPLGLLMGISVVGAFAQRVFLTMEPIIVSRGGGSEALGALSLSIYLGAQAPGTLAGGFLSDRVDRVKLLAALTLMAFPAHLLAVALPPGKAPALLMAGAAGFFGMAMMPSIVVKAQELLPAGTAVGSGIVMGLAWTIGSLAVLATGAMGDWIGPRGSAMISMPALLLGTFLALQPALRRQECGQREVSCP